MAEKKRRPKVEIATKLAPANDLATQGETAKRDCISHERHKVAELENLRLRHIAIDLLLEKIKLEEADRTVFARFLH
jgi:hypothetical protein